MYNDVDLQREERKSEIEKDEVEFGVIEETEVEKGGMGKNMAEESDRFEARN